MALVLADRVQQTGTANTTVSFTLIGSVDGFQSFAVVGNGNTTYYSATDSAGNFEVGIGTYSTTGPTFTRTTILSSSNSGGAVTFSGTVNVFVTYPSNKSVNLDASGNASSLGTPASFVGTNITGTASGLSIGGNAATATNVAYSGLTGTVPTWNQNTTGNAASATTASTANALNTANDYRVNSLGVGVASSGTAGEILATNNITAFFSDERLKTKIGNIENALDKVKQIETLVYHANETAVALGYDASIIEVGVTAQSVQKVMPQVVVPAPIDNKYLTVRYEKLVPLLIEAIKELEAQVAKLKAR